MNKKQIVINKSVKREEYNLIYNKEYCKVVVSWVRLVVEGVTYLE